LKWLFRQKPFSVMPVSTSSTTPDLVEEFERSYSSLVSSLTNERLEPQSSKVNSKPSTNKTLPIQEVEAKISEFMELARALETFFVQRRTLIHAHKWGKSSLIWT